MTEKVGIILVHGIGEQRRFEHLDGQLRFLIDALLRLKDEKQPCVTSVTVDIRSGSGGAFHADQDSWASGPGPSVVVHVEHDLQGGRRNRTELCIHEVWWADVNEPYSLAKQFRFWLWGLAIWWHPGKWKSTLGTAPDMSLPETPGWRWWVRARLYLTGVFFVLLGYSIGTFTFLANRLLNWKTPDVLRVLANYVSGVKLYNQRRRFGPGLWWAREEFLDSVGEPPRVSIRRRMIRAIADVAVAPYKRWYVLAHSLGTIVAFNGLMETEYAWPGYLTEDQWKNLVSGKFAGPATQTTDLPPTGARTMPHRPNWIGFNDVVYRPEIFARFRGFLSYGSPLEKFATLWPAVVPISEQKDVFSPEARWINLYDPIDPVSGVLRAFQGKNRTACPYPENHGYAASWWLLLAHLKYLTGRPPRDDAALHTVGWLLSGAAHFPGKSKGLALGTWFEPKSVNAGFRTCIAWITWLAAAATLIIVGAVVFPKIVELCAVGVDKAWSGIAEQLGLSGQEPLHDFIAWLQGVRFLSRVIGLTAGALALPCIVGLSARNRFIFDLDPDDERRVPKGAKGGGNAKQPVQGAVPPAAPH